MFLPLLEDVADKDVLVIDDADDLFDSESLIGSKGDIRDTCFPFKETVKCL